MSDSCTAPIAIVSAFVQLSYFHGLIRCRKYFEFYQDVMKVFAEMYAKKALCPKLGIAWRTRAIEARKVFKTKIAADESM